MVLSRSGLRERVEEREDRRRHALVVLRLVGCLHVRRRERIVSGGRQAERPLDQRQPQPLEGGDGQVPVEVVAVHGVDVLAKPQARVPDRELRVRHRLAKLGGRPQVEAGLLGEAERPRPAQGTRFEPARDQPIVVVAGNDDDLAGAQTGELCQRWLGELHRLGERAVAELEHVAQEHQAVDPLDGVGKRAERLGPAQEVGFGGCAEMEV